MSSHRDTSVLQIVEKEKQARLALARAEKANHELEQALLEKSSEANSLINHYVQELEMKNEIIVHMKKEMEYFRCNSDLLFEDKLQKVKREHLMTQQILRKEIEDLQSLKADNEMRNQLIRSLQYQMDELKQGHMEEMQEKEENIEMERKHYEDRLNQLHRAFEQFSSEDKLLTLLRKMVVDNRKMAQQLNTALAQIETLTNEREMDSEILQQCCREVELYAQSNDLNIKQNWALKKANHNLKMIINDKLDVAHSEEID